MRALGVILAVVGGVWIIGRVSRLSPNHPVNAVPALLPVSSPSQPSTVNGTWQETAQLPGELIAGES